MRTVRRREIITHWSKCSPVSWDGALALTANALNRAGDGKLNVKEFIEAMGVMTQAAGLEAGDRGDVETLAEIIADGDKMEVGDLAGNVSSVVKENEAGRQSAVNVDK